MSSRLKRSEMEGSTHRTDALHPDIGKIPRLASLPRDDFLGCFLPMQSPFPLTKGRPLAVRDAAPPCISRRGGFSTLPHPIITAPVSSHSGRVRSPPLHSFFPISLDKQPFICYDIEANTVMGTSKRPLSRQRAAGRCKAAGKTAEIPPGVAFLKPQ